MYSITSTKPPSTVRSAAGHITWKAMARPMTAKNSIEPKVSALMKMAPARMLARAMRWVTPSICSSRRRQRRWRWIRSSLAPSVIAW
ncbi:hypothetical protein D3C78_1799580 [compost metagenome]